MKDRYVIAALSDIHSNFSAFEAVLQDAKIHSADEIIIAGDHIGDGPDASAVVEKLMNMDAHIIKGNREDYIAGYHAGLYPQWDGSIQMQPLKWTYEQLAKEQLQWLLNLPEQKSITVCQTTIRIVHGSPRRISELIYRDNYDLIRKALASVDEDILVCGHCHQQYSLEMDGTLIVNPGSVGLAFMGPGYAPYTLLVYENGVWAASERLVKYNLVEYIDRISKSGLMDCGPWVKAVIASLLSGRVVTMAFLNHASSFAQKQGWDGEGVIPNELYLAAERTFDWDEYM